LNHFTLTSFFSPPAASFSHAATVATTASPSS
jgi:hypothetical protein